MLNVVEFVLSLNFALLTVSICVDDHQVAFIQTGDELHYFHEKLISSSVIMNHVSSTDGETIQIQSSGLTFEPPFLKFGDVAVGVPVLQKVTVHNPTDGKVRFDAISGSTVHFHCSFFEHKTIEAGQSTTFDIVFLARSEGLTEHVLLIHSSLGTFQYSVQGNGTPNPYRLRPIVGAKIPLNGSFTSNLVMHNPSSSTLKVLEIFASGGNLHLELPSGKLEESSSIWEIPPFQTKTIMSARFIACRERNTTAYIKIRTNDTSRAHIVLPVEVEATSIPGLYAAVDMIDFGILKPGELSRFFFLNVFNAVNSTVLLESVETDERNDAMMIRFSPLKLQPNTRTAVAVAQLRFDGRKVVNPKQLQGKILIRSQRNLYVAEVPYKVTLISGKLKYDKEKLSFFADLSPNSTAATRELVLSHTFPQPLAVYNVSVSPKSSNNFTIARRPEPLAFNVDSLSQAVIIQSNASTFISVLTYTGATSVLQQETQLHVYTNVTRFSIPIRVYTGKLRVTLYSVDEGFLDFGTMDSGDNRSTLFAITNDNPISVPIDGLMPELDTFSKLELVGMEEGNDSILAHDHDPSNDWIPGKRLTLPANWFAVFRYSVIAPDTKGVYSSAFSFHTPYEKQRIPVTFSVEEGGIISVPDKIFFPDSFPGRISSQPLNIYSTFKTAMPVLRLSTLSHDPRIFFESFSKQEPPVIKPHQMTYLGRVFFFPVAGCLDDCYVGLPLNTEDGQRWVYGMELPPELPEIDMWLYRKLRSKFEALRTTGNHLVNSTIVVDSTTVKGFSIPAQGQQTWPKLIKQSSIHFPLTAIHNLSIANITLHNPTSSVVIVQLIPLPLYPSAHDLLQLFASESPPLFPTNQNWTASVDDLESFTLRDSELFNLRPDSPVPALRRTLERALGASIPRYTLALALQPGMKVRVRIGFRPKDYEPRSSLLLVRNNLTALEVLTMHGRGGQIELRIGSRLPFSVHPLLFEIQEKHLIECSNPKRQQHKLPTSLTVRRSFLARNSGELPIYIGNMSINSVSCQNRGFRILNCEGFVLKPNETHLLEVAFTPDFTLSWFEAQMQLHFIGLPVPFVYTLAASVPREWLRKCQSALPRPYWEPLLYYSSVTALGFLLVCVVASAYLEGDRIITCAQHQQRYPASAPFDLNNIEAISRGSTLANGHSIDAKVVAHARELLSHERHNSPEVANTPNAAVRLMKLLYYIIRKAKAYFMVQQSSATTSVKLSASSNEVADALNANSAKFPNLNKTNAADLNGRNMRNRHGAKVGRGSTEPQVVAVSTFSEPLLQTDGLKAGTKQTTANGVYLAVSPSPPVFPAAQNIVSSGSLRPPQVAKQQSRKVVAAKMNSVGEKQSNEQERKVADKQASVVSATGTSTTVLSTTLTYAFSSPAASVPVAVGEESEPQSVKSSNSSKAYRNNNNQAKKTRKGSSRTGNTSISDKEQPSELLSRRTSVDSETAHAGHLSSDHENPNGTRTRLTASKNAKSVVSDENKESAALAASSSRRISIPGNVKQAASNDVLPVKDLSLKIGRRMQEASSTTSPFSVAASLTDQQVQKNKRSEESEESEASVVPEWVETSVPKYGEDAFEQLAAQTESFTAAFGVADSDFDVPQKTLKGSRSNAAAGGHRVVYRSSGSSSVTSSLEETDSSSSASLETAQANLQKKKKKHVPTAAPVRKAGGAGKSPSKTRTPKGSPSVWSHGSSPGTGASNAAGGSPGSDWDRAPGGLSMMQQLQAERKRRLEDSKKQQAFQGADWPGFELKPVAESLWDEEFDPWKGSKNKIWSSPKEQSYSLFSDATWSVPVSSVTVVADSIADAPFGPLGEGFTRPPMDTSIVAWGPVSSKQDTVPAAEKETRQTKATASIWQPCDLESNPDMDLSWTEDLLKDEL